MERQQTDSVKVYLCVVSSLRTSFPPPGSVLLQQTNADGQTPLDLVSEPTRREELLQSAQLGDSTLRDRISSEVLNVPLLEVGSLLLAHLILSYQQERGLSSLVQPSNRPSSPGCRLVRGLKGHSFQKVTQGWMDQRALRLAQDTETLLELGSWNYVGLVSQAVRKCREENTQFLLEIVENLKCSGEELLADL